MQNALEIPKAMRDAWDDSVVWDLRSGGPKVVTRDQVGIFFDAANVDPALAGSSR